MPRLHLFEIHDQSWCPVAVRDGITDLIHAALTWFRAYDPIAPRLARAISRTRTQRVVDLASGAGGPWLGLRETLRRAGADVTVLLTDRFPNARALARARATSGGTIDFRLEPVDATAVPGHLTGFRTLFTSFHHFRPDAARAILADAVRSGAGIGVFEVTRRRVLDLLIAPLGVLAVLLVAPFARPFRWERLLVTYVLPLLPIAAAFDGFVSCLRTYTPAELRDLVAGLDTYEWETGEEPRRGIVGATVTFLIGTPRVAGGAGASS
jgi:hypothetical protein